MADKQSTNPFSLGPRPGVREQYKPSLESRALPRGAFPTPINTGGMIVESLVNFAGVTGSQYVKSLEKKIEVDKAIQTSRAVQGFTPTDDATLAGYKAHAAVKIKSLSLAAQANLNQIAKEEHSDEEWEIAIQNEYTKADKILMDGYELYGTDVDLQKLSSIALREIIPQVTAQREASKIGFEIGKRINTATDVIQNAAKSGLLTGSSPEDMVQMYETLIGSLKLTESQKDSVLEKAISNTKDPNLIELSKNYKGARKTSLYDRTGSIQSIDKTLEREALSMNAVDLGLEKSLLNNAFINGEMTQDEWASKADKRNKELKGGFISESEVMSVVAQRDKATAKRHIIDGAIALTIDPDKAGAGEYTGPQIQEAFKTRYETGRAKINEEASKLPEDQRADYIRSKNQALVARIGDDAVKTGTFIESWRDAFHNFATYNVPLKIQDEGVLEDFPASLQQALEIYRNLPQNAKDAHLSALGASSARVMRAYSQFTEDGVNAGTALYRAQNYAKNSSPLNVKILKAGVSSVRDSMEGWWRPDLLDNQEGYLDSLIREKLSVYPDASSELAVREVSEHFKTGWTTAGRLRLRGTPAQLEHYTKLHQASFEGAFQAIIFSQADKYKSKLVNMGLTIEDVFPVVEPERQTVQLRTKYGDWLGPPILLKDVKSISNAYKAKTEGQYKTKLQRLKEEGVLGKEESLFPLERSK